MPAHVDSISVRIYYSYPTNDLKRSRFESMSPRSCLSIPRTVAIGYRKASSHDSKVFGSGGSAIVDSREFQAANVKVSYTIHNELQYSVEYYETQGTVGYNSVSVE